MKKYFFLPTLVIIAISCKKQEKSQTTKTGTALVETTSKLAKVPDSWVTNRVAKAKEKLENSEAGKIVWKAMEAHGGLTTWFENGPISFHFNYKPLDGGEPRNTYQTVDTWTGKARHFSVNDSTQQFGWDGSAAWLKAQDSTTFNYNTRFWSLTPYFFMGQPFVLDGKGTNLELLDPIDFNGTMHNVVKVTFESGTGDAPDDYYVLYFSAESERLEVIRYIVSYPGYFEEGKHTPEKFMKLSGEQITNGISFPKNYTTHWLNEENGPGEHITDIKLSEIEFLPELETTYFDIPTDAKVIEGL